PARPPPPRPPLGARLRGVCRRFGAVEALAGVDLEVPAGSFSVLIGPSGCGKTTLLRLLGGLDAPTAGAVEYTEPAAGALSYGFQEPRLLPWLTVAENVALPRALRGDDPAATAAEVGDLLARVGLADAAARRPHELSGGMRMRAAIARALVTRPRLLLLDEPFGALDEITKARLDDELLALWRRLGLTVVLVTHSLTEAVYLGERVHILAPRPGRLSATLEVPLRDRAPATRATREFAALVAEAHRLLAVAELDEVSA
ncbi:MAG: ATP-binding cassette domain-containing protein, partial [Deltaproteobacteria bacterium]|nr:ATP-binding cassette domain-containing protein [Deltaproteobacteria bacterium]